MKGIDIYKIFADNGGIWSPWIRPVPFVAIDTYNRQPSTVFNIKKALFLNDNISNAAIFVDLPGNESIELGADLASKGYNIIPLFNGTDEQVGSSATTATYLAESNLINLSKILKKIEMNNNVATSATPPSSNYSTPAFLLDSYRTNRYRKSESIFDNSWDLYSQDIPSLEFFIEHKIKKIIIVSNSVQHDLKKIFLNFQKGGIEFYITDGYSPIRKIKLKKNFRELFEKEEL